MTIYLTIYHSNPMRKNNCYKYGPANFSANLLCLSSNLPQIFKSQHPALLLNNLLSPRVQAHPIFIPSRSPGLVPLLNLRLPYQPIQLRAKSFFRGPNNTRRVRDPKAFLHTTETRRALQHKRVPRVHPIQEPKPDTQAANPGRVR